MTSLEPQSDFDLDVDSANLTHVAAVLWWTRMEHTHWHATEVLQQDANVRHHLINDIIYRSLARANIHSSREPLGLCRSDGRRPNGVTLTPWRAGKCLIWDATSPDTQAASHINGTSQKAGAAAEQAANQKTDKYRELASKYFFIPVAVETLGPINEDGANFLSELGRRIEQSSMEKRETAHVFERISIAVQRGNAASFAGCFEELEPHRQ